SGGSKPNCAAPLFNQRDSALLISRRPGLCVWMVGAAGHHPSRAHAMRTSFLFANSSRPKRPSSRPIPEFLTPPNGRSGALLISDAGWGRFVSILGAKPEYAGAPGLRSTPSTPPTAAKDAGTQRRK